MQTHTSTKIKHSVLFDPDLPTLKDVLSAICCVATHYAIKPSFNLAKLAADLSSKLTAPEYADSPTSHQIAMQLINQWADIVNEHQMLEVKVLPTHLTLQ